MASISERSWRRQIPLVLGEVARQVGARGDQVMAACAVASVAVGRLVVDVAVGVTADVAVRRTAGAVVVAASRKVTAV